MTKRTLFRRIANMMRLEKLFSFDKLFIVAFFCFLLTSVLRWSLVPDEVTGTVLVSEYSNYGGVPIVAIFGYDGETYEITDDVRKQELMQLKGKTVDVLGKVAKSKKEGKTIKVKYYAVLDE
jgi:hypothetical protein